MKGISMLLLSVVYLCGCSALNSGVGGVLGLETDLKIKFRVSVDVNPDESRTPSPVFLRLYELSDAQALAGAEFLDLYTHDRQILKNQLLGHRTLKRFAPGEMRLDEFVVHDKTRYVALYAEFFHYQGAAFKIVLPVTPHNVVADSFVVRIGDTRIEWQRR